MLSPRLVPAFLLLVSFGCRDLSPQETASLAEETVATGEFAANAPATQDRLAAEQMAFVPTDDGFLASHALMGMAVRLTETGAELGAGAERIELTTLGMSRHSGASWAGFGPARMGECVESGEVNAVDECVTRVERTAGTLTEWWASTPGKVQVGWDISEAPDGRGPIEIVLAVHGAEVVEGHDEQNIVFRTPTRDVGFSGLTAWDNEGEPLDAWMEVEGELVVVQVDDTDATYPIHIDPITYTSGWSGSGPSGGYYGRSVAGIGDVNFDGFADIAVGAPEYSASKGRVYVYHGSVNGISSSAAATFDGTNALGYFGRSVDGAGDVNGDGFDDLIVGSNGVSSNSGAAYIYYGSATGVSSVGMTTLTGAANSQFGFAVSSAGDINRDGYDDVLVGAFALGSPDNVGAVYVYHGATTGLSTVPAATLAGAGTLAGFGIDVENAGDVNDDGYADIIVGASTYNGNTGYAAVYHGSASGISTPAALVLSGAATLENFGASVGTAGDVNADGFSDVVIGAWGAGAYSGQAQVFHGGITGLTGVAAVTIAGPAGSYFGHSVSAAGDVDDDGFDDVLVGAYLNASSSGLVRTYAGSSTGVSSSYAGTASGSTNSCLGYSVASAGDANGDGKGDILAGGYCYGSGNGYALAYYGLSDEDGDGYFTGSGVATASRDCDDTNAAISPGATEIIADGIDNDCNGTERCYDDDDNDGFLDTSGDYRNSSDLDCSDNNEGTATDLTTDCDDNSNTDYPGAPEIVGNSDDENCDGQETCYDDDDNDNYLDTSGDTRLSTDTDCSDAYEGTSTDNTGDCDDSSSLFAPNVTDVVDSGADENCDGSESCYDDDDDDGFLDTSGDKRTSTDMDCLDANEGAATDLTTDCDDGSNTDYPGATEIIANGDDENCDGLETCYEDDDNDNYLDTSGDMIASTDADCSDAYEGSSSDPTTDCDDANAVKRPGQPETAADGIDSNCDNSEVCYVDVDDDGYLTASPGSATSSDGDCADPGEGTTADPKTDCDDTDAGDHPGATETVGNSDDEDCDGAESCFNDDDDDGFVDVAADTIDSDDIDCTDDFEAADTVPATDCDDANAEIRPGGDEVPGDEIDGDCDGAETCFLDDDGDEWGVESTVASFDLDCADAGEVSAGGLALGRDCDDTVDSIHPEAMEVPGDFVDQDCDGGEICYADIDGDGASGGNPSTAGDADCDDEGEVSAAEYEASPDCNEGDAAVSPFAVEICDALNVDENCDGSRDDDDAGVNTGTRTPWYADVDGDGYGDAGTVVQRCDPPEGYVGTDGDCDDSRADVSPGSPELPGTEVDENCDGTEDCYADVDGDGWPSSEVVDSNDTDCADAGEGDATTLTVGVDCDDLNAGASPGGAEVCDDGNVDEDCDFLSDDADDSVAAAGLLVWYADYDGDKLGDPGVSALACDQPERFIEISGDCDDTSASVGAGLEESPGDGIDQDCDGYEHCYSDEDVDGWASGTLVESRNLACDAAGEADALTFAAGEDCADSNPDVRPDAQEVCDEIDLDEDCDGAADDADDSATGQFSAWIDADGDGYGVEETAVYACDPAELYALVSGDCDDVDPAVNPAAEEVCNNVDDNCDSEVDGAAVDARIWYPDADGDGFGSSLGLTDCDQPEAYVDNGDDCDDAVPTVHPLAEEVCNQLDDDCDGEVDPDEVCDAVKLDSDEGCGCSSPGGATPAGVALLFAVGAMVRRRRRS